MTAGDRQDGSSPTRSAEAPTNRGLWLLAGAALGLAVGFLLGRSAGRQPPRGRRAGEAEKADETRDEALERLEIERLEEEGGAPP